MAFAIAWIGVPSRTHAADAARSTVELLHGDSQNRGPLIAIDAQRIQFAEGEPLPVDDAVAIRFASSPVSTAATGPIAYLAGGGKLPVKEAVLVNDACRATLADGRTVTLALNDLAAIEWSRTSEPAWTTALARPSDEHDFVVVAAVPAATAIRAFVESITSETVEFDWDKQTRSLPRKQVLGIVFARSKDAVEKSKLLVHTKSGALIPAAQLRRLEGRAAYQFTLASGSELEIPEGDLSSIAIRTARVKYLSEMQPVEVREKPIIALPRAWQADHNVRGEPLKAGVATFVRGIGVESGSSLTFDIAGAAEEFVAVLAVDSPAGVSGDCEFVVAGDDSELARRRVKSGDEPVALRVPVAGVKRLELRVEYGQHLDFGDHANWCDAHLVMNPVTSGGTPAVAP